MIMISFLQPCTHKSSTAWAPFAACFGLWVEWSAYTENIETYCSFIAVLSKFLLMSVFVCHRTCVCVCVSRPFVF